MGTKNPQPSNVPKGHAKTGKKEKSTQCRTRWREPPSEATTQNLLARIRTRRNLIRLPGHLLEQRIHIVHAVLLHVVAVLIQRECLALDLVLIRCQRGGHRRGNVALLLHE